MQVTLHYLMSYVTLPYPPFSFTTPQYFILCCTLLHCFSQHYTIYIEPCHFPYIPLLYATLPNTTFSYATLSYTILSFYHYNKLQYLMLHHLPLCQAALHLPFNMLSYYILCCPLLHYSILCYLTQHCIKLHYLTLCCLISHLISVPLPYSLLDCAALLYPMLIYPSLCSLCYNMFHIFMIS